jgi:hypothetical protein
MQSFHQNKKKKKKEKKEILFLWIEKDCANTNFCFSSSGQSWAAVLSVT